MEVTGTGLQQEILEVQTLCPGWHLWMSRDGEKLSGRLYATHILTGEELAAARRAGDGNNAVTLELHGVVTARQEIAEWRHRILHGVAA